MLFIFVSFPVMAHSQQLKVLSIGSFPDQLFVRVFDVSWVGITPRWNAQNVCDSFWRFYVAGSEGAFITVNKKHYALMPRRIYLLPSWLTFSTHCSRNVNQLYIHFDVVGLMGSTVRKIFNRPFELASQAAVDEIVTLLIEHKRDHLSDLMDMGMYAKAAIYLSLVALFNSLPKPDADYCRSITLDSHVVTPAIHFIEDNLGKAISNKHLSELCCLSEDHFIRRFRQHVGQTPSQFIIERRVSHAAQQLLFSNQSIEQIAHQFGFANRYYFSRVFVRKIGVSPAAYRKADRV